MEILFQSGERLEMIELEEDHVDDENLYRKGKFWRSIVSGIFIIEIIVA